MLSFCLKKKKVFIAISLAFVYISCVLPLNLNASGAVSLSYNQLKIELKERNSSDQVVQLRNASDEMVFFSAVKSLDPLFVPAQIHLFSEETGSRWQTSRQNYSRDGYNAIESALPPFEYKWRYQSTRSMRTPVVVGRNMYIPGEDGNVYAIDSRTGVYRSTIAFAQVVYSLHLADRHLVAITNEGMMVYDRLSQRHLWKYPTANSSIYSFAAKEGRLYYATGHSLLCLNQDTGVELWQSQGAYESLCIGSDDIFALSSHEVLASFDLVTGQEKFKIKFEQDVQGTPVYLDGLVYLMLNNDEEQFNASVVCLDYSGKIRWNYPLSKDSTAPLACDKEKVYAVTVQGSVIALDRFFGTKLWEENLSSPIHISPTVTSSHVFIGLNNGRVHALNKDTGISDWDIDFKFPLYAELVIAQGLIYTVDNTGSMVAYGRYWENVVPPMSPENAKGYPGNGIVTLYWSVSRTESTLAGYHVYRKMDTEREFSFIEKLPVLNQYQDEKVKNGQRYHYIIRAYDLYGNESPNSSQVSLTPSANSPPIWIEFSPNNGVIKPNDSFDFSLRIRSLNLPPGSYQAYVYFILYSAKLTHEWLSLEINLLVQEAEGSQIEVPSISRIQSSDTRVKLEWQAVNNAQKYFIYRSAVSGDQYRLIRELPSSSLQFVDDQVANNIRYYYAMKVSNSEGMLSDFSAEVSAIPNPLPLRVSLGDHTILYEPVVSLSGSADPKAIIRIRQLEYKPSEEGDFTIQVGVPVGSSDIIIEAQDTSGKIQTRTIPVSFLPSFLQVQLQVDNPVVLVNQLQWPYLLDAAPKIRDQRTFVPLRFLSEIIGAKVTWNAQERKVTYSYRQTVVELWIDQKQIRVDGVFREIDAAPFIENGRTLVPLRFITEPMGAVIQWDAESRIILLMFQF